MSILRDGDRDWGSGATWVPALGSTRKFRNRSVFRSGETVPRACCFNSSDSEVIPWVAFRSGNTDWLNTRSTATFHQMSWPAAHVEIRWSWPGRGTLPRPGTLIVAGWSKQTATFAGAQCSWMPYAVGLYAGS